MTDLINLYTNLFVITITIVGILLASIIALTQLLEPLLASKYARKLIKPTELKLALLFLGLSILCSLPALLSLTLRNHNFFSRVDFKIHALVTNDVFVVISIVLTLASAALVAIFIYKTSRLLTPAYALEHLRKVIQNKDIVEYYTRFSSKKPVQTVYLSSEVLKGITIDDLVNLSDESKEITMEYGKEEAAASKKYEAELKKYNIDKLTLAKMENPLIPLEAFLARAIQQSNLTIVRNTLKTYESIIKELLSNSNFEGRDALIEYYIVVLANADEVAQASNLQSVTFELLNSSSRVADLLVTKVEFRILNTLEEYWRALAEASLNSRQAIFVRTVSVIGETVRLILNNDNDGWDDYGSFIDNACRSLGVLGEKHLQLQAPEEKELMVNNKETQFESIMNAVVNIGWEFHSKHPNYYPLIYFDCLYVITKKLAKYCKNTSDYDGDIGNNMYSLANEVYCFGEAAIRQKNGRGASLALIRLKEHCKIAKENKIEQHLRHSLDMILTLGANEASAGSINTSEFTIKKSETIDDAAITIAVEYAGGMDLSNELHEISVKNSTNENYKRVSKYLDKARMALG